MPTKKAIAKRGRVLRIRTKKLGPTKYLRIYVVQKPGKRGGRTLAGEVLTKKPVKRKGRK